VPARGFDNCKSRLGCRASSGPVRAPEAERRPPMVVPTIGPSRAKGKARRSTAASRSPICARPSFQRKGKAALASTSALRKRRSRAIPSAALQSAINDQSWSNGLACCDSARVTSGLRVAPRSWRLPRTGVRAPSRSGTRGRPLQAGPASSSRSVLTASSGYTAPLAWIDKPGALRSS